jgi:hypothetical protein
LLVFHCAPTHHTRQKNCSRMPLSNNHTCTASKNGNQAYKTQRKFLVMPVDLPDNQQVILE